MGGTITTYSDFDKSHKGRDSSHSSPCGGVAPPLKKTLPG